MRCKRCSTTFASRHSRRRWGAIPLAKRWTFGSDLGHSDHGDHGFMLWNPIATANFFPGQFIPAARSAHGGEALLAVLSIVTWHIYNVHVKHFNRSMFTGYISRHEMEHEHPQELHALMSGKTAVAVDEAAMQRRRRLFVPIATPIALALSLGLYTFVTFEETAITTVPRSGAEVYVPLTPTTPP